LAGRLPTFRVFFCGTADLDMGEGNGLRRWFVTRAISMSKLILRYCPRETNSACGLCGKECAIPVGHQLFVADNDEPVCPACSRNHAPDLAALIHLASAAERVGRMERNSVFPPLTALLDLASAAERYSTARLRMTA
jgi:hypothetical protein